MRAATVVAIVGLFLTACGDDHGPGGGGAGDASQGDPDAGPPLDAAAGDPDGGATGDPDAGVPTVAAVCESLCTVLVDCSGGGEIEGCVAECSADLTGCSDDELETLAACASASCEDIWDGCIAPVGCVGEDEPSCGDGSCDVGECSSCDQDCPDGCICPHDVCTQGGPLDPGCGACEAQVCAEDSFCCTEGWDEICIELAAGCATCGCGDDVCAPGECGDCPADCPDGCGQCDDGSDAFAADAFGYRGCLGDLGPAPPCEDISATGTLGCADDDCSSIVALPFAFDFYGVARTEVSFISNGKLGFLGSESYENTCTLEEDTIAVYWDDLFPPGGGAIRYQEFGSAPDRHVTFQWNVPHIFGGSEYDIRAVLREGSNDIEICYVDTVTLDAETDDGASATVGIAGPAGDHIDYSCSAPEVTSGRLLRFEHP